MTKKRIFLITLLLPLMATSSAALADHNYQHRPNDVRRSSPYDAFAMERKAPIRSVARQVGHGQKQKDGLASKSCTYQGGPKIGLWACR